MQALRRGPLAQRGTHAMSPSPQTHTRTHVCMHAHMHAVRQGRAHLYTVPSICTRSCIMASYDHSWMNGATASYDLHSTHATAQHSTRPFIHSFAASAPPS